MRHLFIVIFALLLLASCSEGGRLNIAVNVSNKITNTVKLRVWEDEYKLELGDSGVASKEIEIPGKTYAYLYYYNKVYTIFLIPGKDINISIDPRERPNRIFANCDDGGINSYLGNERAKFSNMKRTSLYKMSEEEYTESIEKYINIRRDYLEKKKLPSYFNDLERQRIAYNELEEIFFYPFYRKYFTKDKKYAESDKFSRYIDSMFVQNPKLLPIRSYQDFLIRYVEKKTSEKRSYIKSVESLRKQLDFIKENIHESLVSDFLIHYFVYPYVEQKGIEESTEIIAFYNKNVSNGDYAEKFDKLVSRYNKLKQGELSPDFSFLSVRGDSIQLSSLRGKLVYIDVWATWCTPCKEELKYFQRLIEDYKSENISFISISLDSDYFNWRRYIRKQRPKGIHFYAGNNSEFSKAYLINTIPRFILLDKTGKIIDAKAPRPSSKQIRTLLSQHMN